MLGEKKQLQFTQIPQ